MENLIQKRHCRFCAAELSHTFVDLGMSPLCQDHVKPHELNSMEPFYPLHAFVCEKCFLVQLDEFVSPSDIFKDYAYFSSYSDSWLKHVSKYTDMIVRRFGYNKKSLVSEIASNDGYLLQYFQNKKIPVLGIEPAANVAEAAIAKGIRTEVKFFGEKTARELVKKYGKTDLLIGNNVLAHVPDINDLVRGMKIFLREDGVATMEFPDILRLIEHNQFDTIYHEHFSYLSFGTVQEIFKHNGLVLFDVDELPTHGGSIRIYARQEEDTSKRVSERVREILDREKALGLRTLQFYSSFADKVHETKRSILEFLIHAKRAGKSVVGYGAPGKGNTLLNYCGIRTDFIDYTVDRNPVKQGNYLPGTLIPIYPTDHIKETKPDFVFILPWNLKEEIVSTHSYIGEWGGKFVIAIPELALIDPIETAVVAH